jgi:integrase
MLMVNRYLAAWLDRPIDEIHIEDMLAVKNAIGRHFVTANRIIQLVRRLYNWSAARRDGKINFWIVQNPAKEVSTYDEKPRKRFLDGFELNRFNEALKNEKHDDLKDFLVLAINTGARRSDIFGMRWCDVDLIREVWTVPHPKGGEARSYTVQLLDVGLAVLERRRREALTDAVYVFPSASRSGHVETLKKPWKRFLERAQLDDFVIHDLRHTHASYQAIAGQSLQQIAESLGHKSLQSTKRYAQLSDESVKASRVAGQQKMLEVMRAAKRRLSHSQASRMLADGR